MEEDATSRVPQIDPAIKEVSTTHIYLRYHHRRPLFALVMLRLSSRTFLSKIAVPKDRRHHSRILLR
jgi:hypothetical protein